MARSALTMVPLLLLALLATSAYAQTTPPDPSTCDPTGDVTNPDVDLVSLLSAYQSLATYGEDYGLNSTCLANALTNLGSCQEDLTKVSGCCTQGCWDALRSPELGNGCLTSVITAACTMAAAGIEGAVNFTQALFYTYGNCIAVTRQPLTCESFGAPTVAPPYTPAPTYGGCIPLYGGIGAGFYPPGQGNYPPVYGVGDVPAYGVGYGAPIYGVGYPPTYGSMYPPVYGVYNNVLGCVPVYIGGTYPAMMQQMEQSPSPPMMSGGSRRMTRSKATALASELRALRRFHQ